MNAGYKTGMGMINRFETKIALSVLGAGATVSAAYALVTHSPFDFFQPIISAAVAGFAAYRFVRSPLQQSFQSKLKQSALPRVQQSVSDADWAEGALKRIIEAETSVLNEKLAAARADIADFVAGEGELKTTKRIAEEITSLDSVPQIFDRVIFRLHDEYRLDIVGACGLWASGRDQLVIAAETGVGDELPKATLAGIRSMLPSIVASDNIVLYERSQLQHISIGAPADTDVVMIAPIKFLERFIGVIVLFSRKSGANRMKRLLQKAISVAAPMMYRIALSHEQSQQLRGDALTGLSNRNTLTETLSKLRSENPNMESAWLLLVEGDGFLEINHSVGRQAGDQLIKKLSETIREALAPSGEIPLFRCGAAQFAALVVDRKRAMVSTIADRIRATVERQTDWTGSIDKWSVSVGVSYVTTEGDAESLLKNAEDAIAYLKDCKVKNRVMLAQEIPAEFLRRRRAGAVTGSLEAFDPVQVLTSTATSGKSGVLRIVCPGKPEFWGYIELGRLTKAKLGKFKGSPAVIELICEYDSGEFTFKEATIAQLSGTADDVNVLGRSYDAKPLDQLISEAAAIKDKGIASKAFVPSLNSYVMAQPGADNQARWADITTIKDPPNDFELQTMMRIFALSNGSLSVKEMLSKFDNEPSSAMLHCLRLLVEHNFVRLTNIKTYARA